MSHNVGEEIVGLYLQVERGCDFVQYNLYTPDVQGEIDVVAINFRERTAYICEVATHLVTGLQYVKNARPETEERFIRKFNKDIDYGEKYFSDYKRVYMLWSPIVRASGGAAQYDQMTAVNNVRTRLAETRGVELHLIINELYRDCLDALKAYAARETKELKSPVLRVFQIDARLDQHMGRLARRKQIP